MESEPDANGLYSSNWKFFMDYMAPFPKFQRLKNYIKFVTDRKEDDINALGNDARKIGSMNTMGGNRLPRFAKMPADKAKRRALMQHQ